MIRAQRAEAPALLGAERYQGGVTPRLRSAPGHHASRRNLGSILPRLLLAVAGIALVLGAGEIAVRLLDVGPTVGVVYREIFRLGMDDWPEKKDLAFPEDVIFINRSLSGHFGNLSRLRATGPWRDMVLKYANPS